jgi:hypothetical protein
MELNPIDIIKRTGEEELIGVKVKRILLNFWQWAYSDLVGNTDRGYIAEYLVALACGLDDEPRISWDAYDLKLNNGIKLEVKSSAYLQSWKQKDYSKPIFGIPKTIAWDYKENIYDTEKKRQADVYVFALLAHKDKETLNPLDTKQWEFYILDTKVINREMKDAKLISLEKIIGLGAIQCTFDNLMDKIFVLEEWWHDNTILNGQFNVPPSYFL